MEQRLRVVRIIWMALLLSTFAYLGVVLFVPVGKDGPPEPTLSLGMGLAAVMTAVMSFFIPGRLRQQALRQKLDVVEEADPDASEILPYRDAPRRRVFADEKQALNLATVSYQTAFILGMALAEATALFGFVLFFEGAPFLHVIPFFVVAWLIMLAKLPTVSRIVTPLERAYDAKLKL